MSYKFTEDMWYVDQSQKNQSLISIICGAKYYIRYLYTTKMVSTEKCCKKKVTHLVDT